MKKVFQKKIYFFAKIFIVIYCVSTRYIAIRFMAYLPRNVDAGNGLKDIDELLAYFKKAPLCFADHGERH